MDIYSTPCIPYNTSSTASSFHPRPYESYQISPKNTYYTDDPSYPPRLPFEPYGTSNIALLGAFSFSVCTYIAIKFLGYPNILKV